MIIKPVEWDSQFFGYPVGMLVLEGGTLDEQKLHAGAKQFKLVYVTSTTPQKATILSYGDSKKTFGKAPSNHGIDPKAVEMPEEKMEMAVKVGLQSGLWSRFFLDKRFDNKEFERLYRTWVERSVRNEMAYKTVTVLKEGEPGGIITLGKNGERKSTIGLFAVDSKYRGQGIGKRLLETADTISFHRGDNMLTVATQGKNTSAGEVYQRFGFELISETYIYNYWNEAFTV